MKALFAIAALFALTSTASAALPPYYQTVREIRAILDSPEVHQQLGSGRPITSIQKYANGYTVTAGICALNVDVEYILPTDGRVGAAQFELHVGLAACLP